MQFRRIFVLGAGLSLLLAACTALSNPPEDSGNTNGGNQSSNPSPDHDAAGDSASQERDFRIITLLPRDAIPAIDDPVFLNVSDANLEYAPDEQVLGVVFNGEARAYSVPLLSRHEIVNDTVGGVKIAVTW